jgi:hypothetical protein
MLKSTFIEVSDGTTRHKVEGTLEKSGARVDATIVCEIDGRDAWWDDDAAPNETAGIEPGDDDAGWDEVLEALNADAAGVAAVEAAIAEDEEDEDEEDEEG